MGSPCNKDHNMLGSIFAPPVFLNSHMSAAPSLAEVLGRSSADVADFRMHLECN